MNVVITGGLGFIGAHLTVAMNDLGYKVDIVDSISNYYSRGLKLARRAELPQVLNEVEFLLIRQAVESST